MARQKLCFYKLKGLLLGAKRAAFRKPENNNELLKEGKTL